MSLKLSSVAQAIESNHGGNFSVLRLDLERLEGFIAPIMGFDHFLMSGRTFAPHPHAGFSAISYVFEDSPGALRNRDSQGHDLIVPPGGLVWTQAGNGIIHDEFPESQATVHGLQLFVNLASNHKHKAPQVLYASADAIPVAEDAQGNHVRVLAGQFAGLSSPIQPAEPFDFLDIKLRDRWSYSIKRSHNMMIYVLSGSVTISTANTEQSLDAHQAIGIYADAVGEDLHLEPSPTTHLLLLSGQDQKEPVAVYGPFIMNTRAELAEAYERYRSGQMGRLQLA